MSRVLIVAEHLGGQLNASTARCVTAAGGLSAEAIDILLLADAAQADALAAQAAAIAGVGRVRVATRPENANALAAAAGSARTASTKSASVHTASPRSRSCVRVSLPGTPPSQPPRVGSCH